MTHLAAQYVPLVDLRFLQLVENEEGELVGYGLMIPTAVNAQIGRASCRERV